MIFYGVNNKEMKQIFTQTELEKIKEYANLSLQNLSGREDIEEIFNAGIDAGIEEFLEQLQSSSDKQKELQTDMSKVSRVEVIQHSKPYNGRAYSNYNAKDVEIQLQDEGKTLKIFLK